MPSKKKLSGLCLNADREYPFDPRNGATPNNPQAPLKMRACGAELKARCQF
jgi:hypothetical protein